MDLISNISMLSIAKISSGGHSICNAMAKYTSRRTYCFSNSINSSSHFDNTNGGEVHDGVKHKHFERRLLQCSNKRAYQVISDVKNYDKFVPWCKSSKVISEVPDTSNVNESLRINAKNGDLYAELEVGFGMFTEKYTSCVKLTPISSVSATSTQTSILNYLHTEWKLSQSSSDPNKCWVTFQVEFQFKSALYNQVANMFLKEVASEMVESFEKRCQAATSRC